MLRNLLNSRRDVPSDEGVSSLLRRTGTGCTLLLAMCTFATGAFATTDNHYGVHISKAPTQNMVFSNGVYSPTGDNAVLNVGDLETSLAAGHVEVTTGNGSGGDEKGDLHVEAPVRWSNAFSLKLDAYRAIFFTSTLRDAGKGALTLKFGDGGKGAFLRFLPSGNISILRTSDRLTINGKVYTLAADVRTLANKIAADPTGRFALANGYDASRDGTYHSAPIPMFQGIFNGLGNAISNLTIRDHAAYYVGFFGTTTGAKISSILLTNELLVASGQGATSGGLAGWAQTSEIEQSGVIGKITGTSVTGGLIGANQSGTVTKSFAIVYLTATGQPIGGLAGFNQGFIGQSWSAGKTIGTVSNALVGNLVGNSDGGDIEDSYSTGKVSARAESGLGGLLGYNGTHSPVKRSYSTGHVDTSGGLAGGFVGEDNSDGWMQDCYWDTDTSGITNLSQGAGSPANDPGITGLTTAQLQAGLPDGFDPAVWAENAKINGGLPYLIANPPRQ